MKGVQRRARYVAWLCSFAWLSASMVLLGAGVMKVMYPWRLRVAVTAAGIAADRSSGLVVGAIAGMEIAGAIVLLSCGPSKLLGVLAFVVGSGGFLLHNWFGSVDCGCMGSASVSQGWWYIIDGVLLCGSLRMLLSKSSRTGFSVQWRKAWKGGALVAGCAAMVSVGIRGYEGRGLTCEWLRKFAALTGRERLLVIVGNRTCDVCKKLREGDAMELARDMDAACVMLVPGNKWDIEAGDRIAAPEDIWWGVLVASAPNVALWTTRSCAIYPTVMVARAEWLTSVADAKAGK
jgi:hypothetical protein